MGAWGCGDRTHLTDTHGRSYRQALATQAANPAAGAKVREAKGLDPQEASIIARSYRRGLRGPTRDDDERDKQPVLILTGPQKSRRDDGMMPPPSVPSERSYP
jgi:hypothetical protein